MMDDKFKPIDFDSSFGQMKEKLKDLDFSRMALPTMDYELIHQQVLKNEIKPIFPEGYFEKSQEYQQKSLEMLKSINQNTANLYTLVDLISESNEQQDKVIEIISEILAIAKSKEKKEAESSLKKVMAKINDSVKTVDSMVKLAGWATVVYNMVITMLPK